ncbi:general stress protein YciG [Nocardioides cavernae]|uniref:General stress protein YciG n=1 Tax=Nocardioides cavernae TaxID=1921566 RepID=A0A7Y9KUB2_9ACTN|nr:hypothetical protein [Nocardioides cavernae]NYE37738.1 general stress protein YciG [Nocardioides cavernae]
MGKSKDAAKDRPKSKPKGKKGGAKVAKLPKKKCCVSSTKCNRCPLRMLKEGTLPAGYTVKKRRLVTIDATVEDGRKGGRKSGKKGDEAA